MKNIDYFNIEKLKNYDLRSSIDAMKTYSALVLIYVVVFSGLLKNSSKLLDSIYADIADIILSSIAIWLFYLFYKVLKEAQCFKAANTLKGIMIFQGIFLLFSAISIGYETNPDLVSDSEAIFVSFFLIIALGIYIYLMFNSAIKIAKIENFDIATTNWISLVFKISPIIMTLFLIIDALAEVRIGMVYSLMYIAGAAPILSLFKFYNKVKDMRMELYTKKQ